MMLYSTVELAKKFHDRKSALNNLLNLLTGLMTLKQGPQDVPSQHIPALIVYVVTGFVYLAILGVSNDASMPLVLGDAVLLCVGVIIFLTVLDKRARWSQTVTAFCFCGVFLNLLAIVVFSLVPFGTPAEPNPIAVSAGFILLAWSAAVGGNILRHAGEIPFGLGVILMVVFQMVVHSVLPLPSSSELYDVRQDSRSTFIVPSTSTSTSPNTSINSIITAG